MSNHSAISLKVRDHIPLKQGLRPLLREIQEALISCVRDHIPLKQGLRKSPPYQIGREGIQLAKGVYYLWLFVENRRMSPNER